MSTVIEPGKNGGAPAPLTRKDFVTDQEVRWCPGCGDYAILNAVQQVFPKLGITTRSQLVAALQTRSAQPSS